MLFVNKNIYVLKNKKGGYRMMSEKEKYVSPDAKVFLVEKDVLTTSGVSANGQSFGVMGTYFPDQWME